jgi:hypothetical protein
MNDYIITETRQIGIKAESHDEGIKAVMDGGGDLISKVLSANFRQLSPQQQSAQVQVGQPLTKPPPTKSEKK